MEQNPETEAVQDIAVEQSPTAEPAEEIAAEPASDSRTESKFKAVMREHFSAPRLAYMAIFTALAFVVTFLEFPIFPATPFLKFDFANLLFMIEGFIFGPIEAIVSIGIKELLCYTKSSTAGVGELANFIMSTAYIIVPAVAYRFKRGKWWVCLYLACACVMQIGISLLVNRYINFPFFGEVAHFDGVAMFRELWYFVLAFNAIKSVGISLVVFIIYKPLSRFIKMTTEKFDKRMEKAKGRWKEKQKQKQAVQKNAEPKQQ